MSTSSITGTAVRDLAVTITRQLDADKDGKLSATEFEDFLTQFLGALQNKSGSPTPSTTLFNLGPTAAAERPRVGTLSGYSATKLANTAHDTTKYEIGRILQFYPNSPAGLRDALPEIQRIAPNAKIVGSKGDKVDFGDYVDPHGVRIGVIDLVRAAGLGGTAWHWLPVE